MNPQGQQREDSAPLAHAVLVELAAKWLRVKHAVVLTELATSGEEPDAIGWRGARSTLVECKASRSDLLADRNKYFRRDPILGVGANRFILTVPGVATLDSIPEGWGLLEVTGSKIRKIKDSQSFVPNFAAELSLLLSTVRRIGANAPAGVSIRCYTIETKNRATLSVSPVHEA